VVCAIASRVWHAKSVGIQNLRSEIDSGTPMIVLPSFEIPEFEFFFDGSGVPGIRNF
jgi:hypothetical protein